MAAMGLFIYGRHRIYLTGCRLRAAICTGRQIIDGRGFVRILPRGLRHQPLIGSDWSDVDGNGIDGDDTRATHAPHPLRPHALVPC